MIGSFPDKTTEAVFNGESAKGFPADLVRAARRKLRYLDATPQRHSASKTRVNPLMALRGVRGTQAANQAGKLRLRVPDAVQRPSRCAAEQGPSRPCRSAWLPLLRNMLWCIVSEVRIMHLVIPGLYLRPATAGQRRIPE